MIISDIRTHLLSVPYTEPPKIGFLNPTNIDLLVVRIESKSGVTGTGYLHPMVGGMRTLDMCIHEMLKPLLLGEDFRDVEKLWQKMWDATFIQGRMGITVMAMSALDMALWDAAGRYNDKPLWQLWGGVSKPLPAYGSGCYRGLGHDGMIQKAERFVSQGFKAIKMQVAHLFSQEEDVQNVHDMRDSLGDNIEIMADVNQGWTVEEAIAVGHQIDECNLSWLEEPVMADDFDGYHQIADEIQTPVVGGENHFTHHDFKPFFSSGKIPILQPDLMRGGFTGLRIIAEHANQVGITIAPHLFPELSLHLVASIPNPSWLEYMGWHDHLWVEPVLPEKGVITPTDRPGHGMEFRPELFTDYPYTD